MKIVDSHGPGGGASAGFDPAELVFEYVHPERAHKPFKLDLTPGLELFTPRFLLALKDVVKHQSGLGLRPQGLVMRFMGFNLMLTHRVMDGPVDVLTLDYLIGLSKVEGLKKSYLNELVRGLEQAYKVTYLKRALFDDEFNPEALQVLKKKQNTTVVIVRGIATKSKSMIEFAAVMSRLEVALVNQEITCGQWAYFAVQMAAACRHESLLKCTVSDLYQREDENGDLQWYVNIYLAKTGVDKLRDGGQPHLLTKKVGDRLNLHRLEVIKRFGPLFPGQENQIALFPAMHWADFYDSHRTLARGAGFYYTLKHNRTFYQLLGRFGEANLMSKAYLAPIAKIVGQEMTGAQTMRHSLATQAALEGHDAITVQAILGHSNPSSAQLYVDMAFHGLLDQFDELMEAQTASILGEMRAQVHELSKSTEQWKPSQRIQAEFVAQAKDIVTGACKSEICSGVPWQCYDCPEKAFVPFVESDHLALANSLRDSINKVISHGTAAQKKELTNLQYWHLRILATHEACEQYRQEQNKGERP